MTAPVQAVASDPGFWARHFDPAAQAGAVPLPDGSVGLRQDMQRVYFYDPSVVLAVNLAMATQRPLLLLGSPGSGKTTLARNVAGVLGWRYYGRTVTSQTRARDLQWRFDTLRRLSDAQAGASGRSLAPRAAYVEPQLLWWAFDRESAARRGASVDSKGVPRARDTQADVASAGAVVLIDEIDKADPDVPNDLLEVMDAEAFEVEELDPPLMVRGRRQSLLLVITSNGERELPAAFVRRCVVATLPSPSIEQLVRMADERFGAGSPMHEWLAFRLDEMRKVALAAGQREPSTAEYLDAVAACHELGIDDPMSSAWVQLEQALVWKREQALPRMAGGA